MHTLNKFILPIILLCLIGCKKEDDSDKKGDDYIPEPFVYDIPIDSEHDDMFSAAVYKNGRITVTGHTVLDGGESRGFLVLVDSKGNIRVNKQFTGISDLYSPAFRKDGGYVCLGRKNDETEVLMFNSGGEIVSAFTPVGEVYPLLGFSSPLDSSVLKKVIVASNGSILITGEIFAGREQQAFLVKTDDKGMINDMQRLRGSYVNDLAELSNGHFAWLAKGYGEEATSLILLNDSLTFPSTFRGTMHGNIYARSDLPGLYTASFMGIDKWSNGGSQAYSIPFQFNFYLNASVANDGGLVMTGDYLTKYHPGDGSIEWIASPLESADYIRFIHQLPDGMYLGISSKDSLGIKGDIDLRVFRIESPGE